MEKLELKYLLIYAAYYIDIYYPNPYVNEGYVIPDNDEDKFDLNTWSITKINIKNETLNLMNNCNSDEIISKIPIENCKLVLKPYENSEMINISEIDNLLDVHFDMFGLIKKEQAIEQPKF